MYSNIVLTGGKSILGKFNLLGKFIEDNNIEHVKNLKSEDVEKWIEKVKVAFQNSKSDPKKVSVEYSLVHTLKEMNKLANNPDISIIHTNTKEGIISAKLNEYIFRKDFNANVILKGVDFDINDRIKLNKQYGEFMDILVTELQKGNIYNTFFSPTPGYKVMSYLGYVAGSFYGYKMGYLYEEGSVFQEVPPIPIKFDIEESIDYLYLIKEIQESEIKYNSLSKMEQEFIDNHTYFFDTIDGVVVLNAFGLFLFKNILTTEIFISDELKEMWDKLDNDKRKFVKTQIFELIRKIKLFKSNNNSYKGELMHNKSWEGKRFNKPYLYKSITGNIFRAVWDTDENKLNLYYIWLDHDKYEREYEKIMQKYQDYKCKNLLELI
ncbi:hypothetical protein XO10_02090 [Marinitoga sp. 1135]|uniref:CRISPR-associated protein (Cas_APE2256) n=1 Tax=Marinitoga piezophila (strain DSM 14283 / JCM 11233 / KA3) TaxID=443254 RepID=H2J4R6_MARPK|nr:MULTISPECIES: CRISPR-associated protein [Marinitoga]AEX84851.1 CRISPR-associated protein (Cas_APE2256) [Marinitoga piezophila KA3]APT75358.1 hypothetical protein LN42_02375 [Marinitoga sp. 1137]NUU95088.1 hypothetical protein [Marinitoga sp. 1135]